MTSCIMVSMVLMITLGACLLADISCLQDPLSEPNWSLSIRRSQVVNALESALCILSDAEEAWLAWRHASSQTETQLRRLFRSGHQQHNVHEQVCPTHIWCWLLLPCCTQQQSPGIMSHHNHDLSLLPWWRVWQLPWACTFLGLFFARCKALIYSMPNAFWSSWAASHVQCLCNLSLHTWHPAVCCHAPNHVCLHPQDECHSHLRVVATSLGLCCSF